MPPDEARLQDAVDYVELRRLQDDYADIVSRRRWDDLAGIFRPDCTLELNLGPEPAVYSGPTAIGEFIAAAVGQFEFFQFGILGTRLGLRDGGDPDAAVARMYMTELRQTPGPHGHWSQIYGVYHDRYARVAGRWWFAHRRYHSLVRRDVPATILPFPEL